MRRLVLVIALLAVGLTVATPAATAEGHPCKPGSGCEAVPSVQVVEAVGVLGAATVAGMAIVRRPRS